MEKFSRDWTSAHTQNWLDILAVFVGRPHVHAIDIGAFEGRSTLWFLENILTHPTARLICIDRISRPEFIHNTMPYRDKLQYLIGFSQDVLRGPVFRLGIFSFVYVDGNHAASSVLEDAVLGFRLLKAGGVMIFDDYQWLPAKDADPLLGPQLGIDAFLRVFAGQYRILFQKWQLAIEKNRVSSVPIVPVLQPKAPEFK